MSAKDELKEAVKKYLKEEHGIDFPGAFILIADTTTLKQMSEDKASFATVSDGSRFTITGMLAEFNAFGGAWEELDDEEL